MSFQSLRHLSKILGLAELQTKAPAAGKGLPGSSGPPRLLRRDVLAMSILSSCLPEYAGLTGSRETKMLTVKRSPQGSFCKSGPNREFAKYLSGACGHVSPFRGERHVSADCPIECPETVRRVSAECPLHARNPRKSSLSPHLAQCPQICPQSCPPGCPQRCPQGSLRTAYVSAEILAHK